MTKVIALALVLVGSTAMADQVTYKMPSTIKCSAPKAVSPLAREFTISKLDTKRPQISFKDGTGEDSMEDLTNTYIVELGFSNECDSSYGAVIMGEDLQKLKDGKVSSVTGLFNYANEDLDMSRGENVEQSTETVVMTCVLTK